MSATEIFQILKDSMNPNEVARQLINQHPEVNNKVKRLKDLKAELYQQNLIAQTKLSKRSTLFGLLDGKGNKIIVDNDTDKQLIVNTILEGYHLTSEILQDLGFIDKVTYTYTYIDSKGQFHRAGDMILDASSVKLEAASRGRGYSLRMNSSAVQAQIAAKSSGSETDALINLHFQKFAAPYFEYEQHNNTDWKINKGVLAEAFERHWENMQHSLNRDNSQFEKNAIGNDLESVGARWWMYRLSSGSAAYYTGPDTLYAQVKNANASLIDNVNTVLNTMDAIIRLFDETLDIENIAEHLERAFVAAPDKMNIPTKIWNGLKENVQNEILEAVSSLSNVPMENIKISVGSKNVSFDFI